MSRRIRTRLVGLPKEVVAGLLVITIAVAVTGALPSHRPDPARARALDTVAAPPTSPSVPATTSTSNSNSTSTSTSAPATTSTSTPPTTTPGPRVPSGPPATVQTTQAPVPSPALPAAAVTVPTPPTAAARMLGVYTGAANPSGAASFAATTGTTVSVVEDYLPGGSWSTIDGSGGSLAWMFDAWRGSGYRLVLGVPMFDNSGTDTLAQGAAGAYDQYFVTLAQTLVAAGQGNAILRIGQEFTGSWNPWRVTDATDAANYAAYYRNIVTSMRSVPGQALSFIWEGADPQDGSYPGAYTAEDAYPGDAYVDYIGTDVYDQSWNDGCGIPFNNTVTAAESQCNWTTGILPGLNRVAAFATAHDKPVAFPEWGLAIRGDGHGLGDDPVFVQDMASWMASNNVALALYFDFDVSGQMDAITDGQFPNALAAFRAAFG